jgi:hypothetical protein
MIERNVVMPKPPKVVNQTKKEIERKLTRKAKDTLAKALKGTFITGDNADVPV